CLSLSTARVLLRFLSDDTAATEIYTLSLHDALPICEKNSDKEFDFDNDPIEPMIVDGWVKANGTTLGADCGIGIAAQLAVLTTEKIKHGPLECLITVDEETGLTGAFNLQPGFLTGSVLLNLDSEDEGEIFIGCAGGVDTLATF